MASGNIGHSGERAIAVPAHMPPEKFVFQHLALDDTISMVTNGVGSVRTFSYTIPDGSVYHIERVNFVILDGSSDPGDFGGLSSLGTGCRFLVVDSDATILADFSTETGPIKRNADFGLLAGTDVVPDAVAGVNDDAIYIRWTITKAGHPLEVSGGQQLAFEIRDDLTGLSDFMAVLQGVDIT